MSTKLGTVALLIALFLAAPQSHADVSLSVSGLRGASLIDLGELSSTRSSTHEEVTIGIANDAAQRYNLTQVISSSLVNESGVVLESGDIDLEISSVSSGTVPFSGAFGLSDATFELFTSNTTGSATTLTLIYSLSIENLPQAGTYIGAITYTVQTVEGSSVDTRTMPVRLVVQPITKIEIAPDGASKLDFGNLGPEEGSEVTRLVFDLTNNSNQAIQVQQVVSATLENENGESLPLSAISIAVQMDDRVLEEKALVPSMTVLTDETGVMTTRRLELLYRAIVPESQRSGLYQGLLTFVMQTASGADIGDAQNLILPIEVEVLPVLSLTIEPTIGTMLNLDFDRLSPGMTSPPQTLSIEVDTNMGIAYQVYQELAYHLISDEGHKLPEESFVCVAVGEPEGILQPMDTIPVSVGKQVIYQSNADGNNAKFSISYQVQVPENAAAGVYKSQMMFTATTF